MKRQGTNWKDGVAGSRQSMECYILAIIGLNEDAVNERQYVHSTGYDLNISVRGTLQLQSIDRKTADCCFR